VTVSMLRVVPEATASGTAPCPEPNPLQLKLFARSGDTTRQAVARAARDDFPDWLDHVRSAAQCSRPMRLSGTITTYHSTGTGTATDPFTYRLSTVDTADLPDGVIYKRCGNRRASVCPSCSKIYQRDAYQIIRAGLAGGKGVPDTVAAHPAIFATLTAPSFGTVHNRVVARHTCGNRARCDCRPEICHPRRDSPRCPHGRPAFCFARHEAIHKGSGKPDRRIGTPLCPDCYDYDAHVVWNHYCTELWRRTKQAIDRELAKLCQAKGIDPVTVGVSASGKPVTKPAAQTSCGKAAEFQQRAVVHFHALIRLDGRDLDDPDAIVPPPAELTVDDLDAAIRAAARSQSFDTPPHPDNVNGWRIAWGEQIYNLPIVLSGHDQIDDALVAKYVTRFAGYLAKYATKSTEVTGHSSARITEATIGHYGDASGNHVQRLIAACWRIGRPHRTELLAAAYNRLLKAIGATGLELGRLPEGDTQRQPALLDCLHTTIDQLVEVADRAPKPLHGRPGNALGRPASGAVNPWVCPACGTRCRTTQCLKCAAPQHEQARRQLRLLLLLLLAGTVQAPEEEAAPYAGLRRWVHMLGFRGHFFSQSARYSIRFRVLREARITFRRNENTAPTAEDADADRDGEHTTLLINTLTFAGVGWHTTADAMLAQTSSALAREQQQLARHLMANADF